MMMTIQTQMALFFLHHVILIVVFCSMTSHATEVSGTFKVQVNSTGGKVCAVDKPSTVIPMALRAMRIQCGGKCNVDPSCQLFQFKEDLAQCELFDYSPSNFSPIDHCTAFSAPPVCIVNAVSWGYNAAFVNLLGGITLNGTVVLQTTWFYPSPYRGFHLIELNVESCTMSSYHHFQTGDTTQSNLMATYLSGLPISTVLVGVTADDAWSGLTAAAKSALLAIGVNVAGLALRGKVSFVAQVGQPSTAAMKLLATPPNDFNVLTATVRKIPGTANVVIEPLN